VTANGSMIIGKGRSLCSGEASGLNDRREIDRGRCVRASLRLTGGGNRGCNEQGGPEFVSKRRPVPSVLVTAETTSSVPPPGPLFSPAAGWPPIRSGFPHGRSDALTIWPSPHTELMRTPQRCARRAGVGSGPISDGPSSATPRQGPPEGRIEPP